VITFGVLAIVIAAAIGSIILPRRVALDREITEVVIPGDGESQPSSSGPAETLTAEKPVKTKSVEPPTGRRLKAVEKNNGKTDFSMAKHQLGRIQLTRKSPSAITEAVEEFSPLTFTGGLDNAQEDGKVIRIRLSRSALQALGLKPPTIHSVIGITTDLLIGSDGLPRGYRFVK
jgi:hypothetical protein